MGNCLAAPAPGLVDVLGHSEPYVAFTGAQLDDLLTQVAARLSRKKIDVKLLCVGGYLAVCFFGNRNQTGDIDVIKRTMTAKERAIFNKVVKKVTKKTGLPGGWLNNGCELFFPPKDDHAAMQDGLAQGLTAFQRPGLTLVAYRPAKLLAGKLARQQNHDLADAKAIFDWMCETEQHAYTRIELEELLGTPINLETFSALIA